jgi:hypothetical protein
MSPFNNQPTPIQNTNTGETRQDQMIGVAVGMADDALLLRVNRALALFLSIV